MINVPAHSLYVSRAMNVSVALLLDSTGRCAAASNDRGADSLIGAKFPDRMMGSTNNRLDDIVAQARREAEQRAAGYRERALKMYPWVCGMCARTFTHGNLHLLEVHHKNGNHSDNPADGSNWELLCTYCHEHEHSKLKDAAGRDPTQSRAPAATHNPFADLKARLAEKRGK